MVSTSAEALVFVVAVVTAALGVLVMFSFSSARVEVLVGTASALVYRSNNDEADGEAGWLSESTN